MKTASRKGRIGGPARYWALVLALATACGCTPMVVKNTDGIKECINQEAKAEITALRVKGSFAAGSPQSTEAANLYDQAAGSVNGFLRGVSFDAQAKRVVEVSLATYQSSPASSALDKFTKRGEELVGAGIAPAALVPILVAAAEFAISTVTKIQAENDKREREAVDRVVSLLKQAEMAMTFGGLSVAGVDDKYKKPK